MKKLWTFMLLMCVFTSYSTVIEGTLDYSTADRIDRAVSEMLSYYGRPLAHVKIYEWDNDGKVIHISINTTNNFQRQSDTGRWLSVLAAIAAVTEPPLGAWGSRGYLADRVIISFTNMELYCPFMATKDLLQFDNTQTDESSIWAINNITYTTLPDFALVPTPRAILETFYNAAMTGDGRTILDCLCSDQVEALNAFVSQLKSNPEESAQMFVENGIAVTSEAIQNIDTAGYLSLVFRSEVSIGFFADAEIAIGSEQILGSRAWVEVTRNEETEQDLLVIENGRWCILQLFE